MSAGIRHALKSNGTNSGEIRGWVDRPRLPVPLPAVCVGGGGGGGVVVFRRGRGLGHRSTLSN